MTTRDDLVSDIRDILADNSFPTLPLTSHGIDAHRSEWAQSGTRKVLYGGEHAYGCLSDFVELINAVPHLLSALEAKDAEIARQADWIRRLQAALSFWMPGVDLRLDDATRELAAHDAEMLAGYAGPIDQKCWGDEILERAIADESRITSLERQLAEETERCATIADCFVDRYDATAFTSDASEQVSALRAKEQAAHDIAAAIRGGAK